MTSPQHVDGFVDSLSAFGVVQAMHPSDPRDICSWAWQNAIEVTTVLIGTDHLKLSPEPTEAADKAAGVARYASHMQGVLPVNTDAPSRDVILKAKERTRRWVRDNLSFIKRRYAELKETSTAFRDWVDWNLSSGHWVEHAQRSGGLIDPDFLPVAPMLLLDSLSAEDLKQLAKTSSDVVRLKALAEGDRDSDEFRQLVDATVLSVLIRGRYYAYVGELMKKQTLLHPVRDAVFRDSEEQSSEAFSVPNTLRYLSTILVASAFRHHRPVSRMQEWSEGVRQVIDRRRYGGWSWTSKHDDYVAEREAVRLAREIGISTRPKSVQRALDVGISVGVGLLTGFLLSPWIGFGAGIAWEQTQRDKGAGKALVSLTDTENRLSELAHAEPGRLLRRWTGPQVLKTT